VGVPFCDAKAAGGEKQSNGSAGGDARPFWGGVPHGRGKKSTRRVVSSGIDSTLIEKGESQAECGRKRKRVKVGYVATRREGNQGLPKSKLGGKKVKARNHLGGNTRK